MMDSEFRTDEIFERCPIGIEDGIPVFSKSDDYVANYETIAADHLAASTGSQSNPWIDEKIWEMMENSTTNLVQSMPTACRAAENRSGFLMLGWVWDAC